MSFPSLDTYDSLVEEVILALEGWGAEKDQMGTLASNINSTATTISVTDIPGTISRGIAEIDYELIWVQSAESGTLTVPAWGRGYKGTTAASHTAGAMVAINPTWPRSVVSREVNNAIRALYPALYAVGTTEITTTSLTWQYELPAALTRVLRVEWRWNDLDGWNLLDGWDVTHSANTTDFPSGIALSISAGLPPGTTVRVTYAKAPTLLTAPADLFSATGLPSSSRDLVVLGAAIRMVPWLDLSRLSVQSAEADALDQPRPLGSAAQLKRELRRDYDLKLVEERRALEAKYPLRQHRVR